MHGKSGDIMVNKLLTFLFCICLFAQIANAKQPTDIQVVVFDFGGVIAKADTAQMSNFLMNSFGVDKEELSIALRNMQSHIANGESEEEYWTEFAASKNITLAPHWIDQWDAIIKNSITEIPGTIALVKALQSEGYQTAMLSDVTQYQAKVIRKIGYYDLFHPVLLSYEIGVKKPDPEAFKILLKTLNEPASHVLFIDDRMENVDAAKKLGIDSIQFVSPEQLKKELEERGFELS